MNLYLIRRAEPDYAADTRTEKGWREAALMAERFGALSHLYAAGKPASFKGHFREVFPEP